jgi:poly(A) polymerase
LAQTRRKKTGTKKAGSVRKRSTVKKQAGTAKRGGTKRKTTRKPVSTRRATGKPALRKAAEEVATRLARAGYEAVFAGGCVRDMVMGVEPKDYDIATSATPLVVQELFKKTYAVGAQFGVVVVLHRGQQFEVATFRVDSTYSDGRHPDAVTFGDARADVMRRDFTINGTLYDPKKGEVIDYVGGQKDLKAGIVRCIGEPAERFAEDKLRMLRAVRFAARLGFEIEPATRGAIMQLAPQVVAVSQERIKTEIELILTSRGAGSGVLELHGLGLLRHVLPEADGMSRTRLADGSLLEHAVSVLEALSSPSFDLSLAALLHCCGGAGERESAGESTRLTSVAARRLKCSNAERSCAVWLVQNQYALENLREQKLSRLKRLLAHGHFSKLMALFTAKSQAGCAAKEDCKDAREFQSKLKPSEIAPEPLLTGTDLIEMGLKPSELFAVILEKVYDAQLDGEISERRGAIDLALKIARES